MRLSAIWAVFVLCLCITGCGDDDDVGVDDGGAGDADTDSDGDADTDSDADVDTDTDADSDGDGDVTVYPERIDDVLINPGMGIADFHFGWWCNLPPVDFTPEECAERVLAHWPENYPDSATAYFRWLWRELEPVRGEIDFNLIDTAIQSANLLGETLSFRVVTIDDTGEGIGVPDWLKADPYNVPDVPLSGEAIFWPDYRNEAFQAEHARFIAALGERYNNHPGVDHVDIGSVGCWGEWNTACLDGVEGIFEVFEPQSDDDYQEILGAFTSLIDHHTDAFPDTPVVMLGIGSGGGWELDTMMHAIDAGTGWRVDCWGDWGFWDNFTHMENLYPDMIANATAANPDFPDVRKTAPIQLEICGVMSQWLEEFGWTADAPDGEVYKTFQWALEQHASVLNAKFNPIPADYVPAMEEMLRQNGYRFVIDRFNHFSTVRPGEQTQFISDWSNIGVAPSYLPRALTYRLRSTDQEVTFTSPADIRTWLPGQWQVVDTAEIPADLPPGTYALELALLDRAGTEPTTAPLAPLFLGIEGRQPDGWYAISQITVTQ